MREDGEDVVTVAVVSVVHLAPERQPPVAVVNNRASLHSPDADLEVGDRYTLYAGWRQAGTQVPVVVFGLDAEGEVLPAYEGRSDNGTDVADMLSCVRTGTGLGSDIAVLDALAARGRDNEEGKEGWVLYRCGTG